MNRLFPFVMIILLAACVSSHTKWGVEYKSTMIPPLHKESARIFFLNEKKAMAASSIEINIDNNNIVVLNAGYFHYIDTIIPEINIDIGDKNRHRIRMRPEASKVYYLSVIPNIDNMISSLGIGMICPVCAFATDYAVSKTETGMININTDNYKTINNGSSKYQLLLVNEKEALEKLKEMRCYSIDTGR